jgi:hypothetical protein
VPLVTGLEPAASTPMALSFVVAAIETRPVYRVEAVVGVAPLVV